MQELTCDFRTASQNFWNSGSITHCYFINCPLPQTEMFLNVIVVQLIFSGPGRLPVIFTASQNCWNSGSIVNYPLLRSRKISCTDTHVLELMSLVLAVVTLAVTLVLFLRIQRAFRVVS
ncbi:hypothetical protein U0070_006384 [Myodes glareolus]|uniref:Uncharacterized protein n=1 Tax=Myodes glareolus TaxID=447135 RepID=A0AAW0I079_MYOGA